MEEKKWKCVLFWRQVERLKSRIQELYAYKSLENPHMALHVKEDYER